jgi:hypothetical protein
MIDLINYQFNSFISNPSFFYNYIFDGSKL